MTFTGDIALNALLSKAVAILIFATAAGAQTCPSCVPLSDLGPGLYLGQHQGGLYPAGQNTPPPAHQAAIDAASGMIRPLDASGRPTLDGLIGFITIGMSNATMEFGATEALVDADSARNARVVIVNTALGSHPIELINMPTEDYWTLLDARLAAAGLTRSQVQVLWIKQAFGTVSTTTFPDHAVALKEQYVLLINHAKQRFRTCGWPICPAAYTEGIARTLSVPNHSVMRPGSR